MFKLYVCRHADNSAVLSHFSGPLKFWVWLLKVAERSLNLAVRMKW